MHQHIDPRHFCLAALDYGSLEGQEAWLQHLGLVALCEECQERVRQFLKLDRFDRLFSCDFPWDLISRSLDRDQASPLLRSLDTLPLDERIWFAGQIEEVGHEAVLSSLLDRCRQRWVQDPGKAMEDALLATRIAAESPRLIANDPYWNDLQARAWAYLGNVQRIHSDLRSAAESFQRSSSFLDQGWWDEKVAGEVLDLHSSLLRAEGHYSSANEALQDALCLFEATDSWVQQGRVLIAMARVRREMREPIEAMHDLDRAEAFVGWAGSGRLRYCVATLRLDLLCDQDRYSETTLLLQDAQRLAQEHGNVEDLLRVRWREGLIAAHGSGDLQRASQILREVRDGFIAGGNGYDAGLVTLDLAELLVQEGQAQEVRQLASQIIPMVESRDIPADTLASLVRYI